MIIFKRIRFKNFLSYGNVFTEIQLDKTHTTVLVGESGSGKSSITDAIVFALYGKPFRNINKPQLVNTINKSDCVVEIEFSIGSSEYKIVRGIKPNIFEIYCNGTMLNQDSHTKDYQEYLEKNIIKMSYKTFLQTVILGMANFTPFMQMKAPDRRMLVEDLLDIQIFSKMSTILKSKIAENKDSINLNESKIKTSKERVTIYQKYIEDIKKDRQKQIDDNNEKMKEISSEVVEYDKKIELLKTEIDEKGKLFDDEESVNKKIKKYNDFIRDIQNNLRNLNKEMNFYETNKNCPTCNRVFEEGYKEEIIKTRSSKKAEYEEALKKVNTASAGVQKRSEEIQAIKKEVRDIESKKTQIENQKTSAILYFKKIKKENEELESKKKDTTEETEKLQVLNEEIKTLEIDREDLFSTRAIYDMATSLLKDGGIKAKIIKQYIPIINKLVNQFLSSMNFFISFNMDENFDETIRSRGRDTYTYTCFSDGERQRLDIAILLTWRTIATMKNSIKTNLLFIDELLDSCLDQSASENVIDLINTEPILSNTNIFIVTHKNGLIDRFSNKIVFAKQKNFSTIVA